MKWVKHMTASRRDTKLLAVKREFGLAGIGMFWVTVEAIAEAWDGTGEPVLTLDYQSWRELTGISPQMMRKWARFGSEMGLFSASFGDEMAAKRAGNGGEMAAFSSPFSEKTLTICMPKVKEIRDNHTSNLQVTSNSTRARKKEKKSIEENTPPNPPKGGLSGDASFGGLGDKKPKTASKAKRNQKYSSSFLAFWEAYPRKTGKGYAWECWQSIGQAGTATVPEIMAGLTAQVGAGCFSAEVDKIAHPSTWLNQRRWEDEIQAGSVRSGPSPESLSRARKEAAAKKREREEQEKRFEDAYVRREPWAEEEAKNKIPIERSRLNSLREIYERKQRHQTLPVRQDDHAAP